MIRSLAGLGAGASLGLLFLERQVRQRRRRQLAATLGSGSRSMMLGTAIGDAFGAGLEFQSADWIRDERNVDFTKWVNVRGAYFTMDPLSSQNFCGGMYTDDAEMTVAVIKALISTKGPRALSADDLVEFFREEYELAKTHFLSTRLWGLLGVGRNGHGSMRWVYDGSKGIEEVRDFQRARAIPGNAGPMRSLPLAFLPEDERLRMAIVNADSTHPHPKARLTSYLLATGAAHLISGSGSKEAVIRRCIEAGAALESKSPECYDRETLEYLAEIDKLPDYHSLGPRQERFPMEAVLGPQPIGWATKMRGSPVFGLDSDTMHTLGVVLYLLKWHQGPLDALQHSVWIGGDVDSSAALVLGVIGAKDGLNFGQPGGLPLWMLEGVEAAEYLVRVADSFDAWRRAQKTGH